MQNRWRRGAGAYLALFFLAVAAAPHRHLDGLADMLLDQRSDSGVLVQSAGSTLPGSSPSLTPLRLLSDVPCPACFTRDFASAAPTIPCFVALLTPLTLPATPPPASTPELLPADTSSRAPPRPA